MDIKLPESPSLRMEGNNVFQAHLDLLLQNNAMLKVLFEISSYRRGTEPFSDEEMKFFFDERYLFYLNDAQTRLFAKYGQ